MMMLPGTTASPPNFLTPRRRPSESRPLREEPPDFLCAMRASYYSSVFLALGAAAFFGAALAGVSAAASTAGAASTAAGASAWTALGAAAFLAGAALAVGAR